MGTPLFYYIIVDHGDGSFSLRAFKYKADAEKACQIEEELNGYVPSEGVVAFFDTEIEN